MLIELNFLPTFIELFRKGLLPAHENHINCLCDSKNTIIFTLQTLVLLITTAHVAK